MINQIISCLDAATWADAAATSVIDIVLQVCQMNGSCSVMLTGGRSAERLYQAWARRPEFSQMRNVRFYFGDERCVPPEDLESNYGMVMRSLFRFGVPPTCSVIRINAEQPDREAAAAAYEAQLPDNLDILLLSVGEDGHVASIFPHSPVITETTRKVVFVRCPRAPSKRISISPLVIRAAQRCIVMALGSQKRAVYEELLRDPTDIKTLPARLALDRTWIFGE